MNKMQNQGMHCIWLGFADNHASECYTLLNSETKQVVISRDVTSGQIMWKLGNVKDTAIVPLETHVIDTFDEDNEMDVPNLIPLDHGPDDKSMIEFLHMPR